MRFTNLVTQAIELIAKLNSSILFSKNKNENKEQNIKNRCNCKYRYFPALNYFFNSNNTRSNYTCKKQNK